MIENLTLDNYGIEIANIKLIEEHFGTELLLIETTNKNVVNYLMSCKDNYDKTGR